MTEPAKTTAVDDARKDEYEDEIVWPAPKIGPRMPCMSQERYDNLIAAEAKVAELEAQLRQAQSDCNLLDIANRRLASDLNTLVQGNRSQAAQLRQEREAHAEAEKAATAWYGTAEMHWKNLLLAEAQVAQLQATMGQLRKAAQKMTACHHDTCAATLSTVAAYPCSCGKDELLAALATCPAPSQEKPQP